jgi:hypothetical protein
MNESNSCILNNIDSCEENISENNNAQMSIDNNINEPLLKEETIKKGIENDENIYDEHKISQYFYGNPPPSSVSGPNAGECKENTVRPCFNKECENCKRNHNQQNQQKQTKKHEQQIIQSEKIIIEELYEECPICFDLLDTTQEVCTLECKHQFHLDCLIDWYRRPHSNYKCPNCYTRREIILIENTKNVAPKNTKNKDQQIYKSPNRKCIIS